MLNYTELLYYIKESLSFPSGFLEKNDEQLKKWIQTTSLRTFSEYCPDVEVTGIDTRDKKYIYAKKPNHYLIYDEENLDIYAIKDVIYEDNSLLTGHPIVGAMSMYNIRDWALSVFNAKLVAPLNSFTYYTHYFYHPNILRILPDYTGKVAIEYERQQPKDLRKIPPAMHRYFSDLALADVMLQIGRLRTQYNSINTPFGDLNINGDALKSDGQELRAQIIDKLEENNIPPIVLDIG